MLGMRMVEAGWLLLEKPASPMHISSLLLFKKAKNYNVLHYWRKRFAKIRPTAPFDFVLSRNLQNPLGAWDDADVFDFDYHVRGLSLAPGENSPADLHKMVAWLHSMPLDRHQPLWQLYVIEGLPDNRYAILIKVHHALADGAFGMDLMERMLCHTATEKRQEPFWSGALQIPTSRDPKPASRPLSLKGFREFIPLLNGVGQGLVRTVNQKLAMTWPFQAPPSLFNQEITQRRHLEVSVFPMAEIQDCAHRHDATINDIVLFLTGTALRAYMRQKHNLPKQSLNALIAVSLRTQEESGPGCRLGFALAELGTQDPGSKQRLTRIKRSTAASKKFLQNFKHGEKLALTTALDVLFVTSHFVPKLSKLLPQVANLLVSNVKGPKQKLFFNGDPLEQIVPLSVLLDGQSINVTALSYDDKLFVSCISCPDIVTDPEVLQSGFAHAWDELQNLSPRQAHAIH